MLCASLTGAMAGSVTQPGSTVGTAAGAPLPEGGYFSNTADWGVRAGTRLFVDHPVYIWSTPWMFLGARVQLLAETAFNERDGPGHTGGFYNPLITGQLAWDLGNGLGFSYTFGAYIGVQQPLSWSSSSLNQRFALSYTRDGWNLTANAVYGIQLDAVTSRPQISSCRAPFAQYGCNPDFFNLDLTATRKFDRWELGPVAFGSSDLTRPLVSYAKTSQVAVGGLIGYDFGHVRLQVYLTREIYESNYGGLDTRVWGRVTLPLWIVSRQN
jgi:hypothetical protein